MFESVRRDPGAEGLNRAALIFYTLAALTGIGTVVGTIVTVTGERSIAPLRLVLSAIFIILAVITGRGIEQQKAWAKWAGYILGLIELLNFPIGTVIGIAILIYISRASRAGLFTSGAKTAAPSSG